LSADNKKRKVEQASLLSLKLAPQPPPPPPSRLLKWAKSPIAQREERLRRKEDKMSISLCLLTELEVVEADFKEFIIQLYRKLSTSTEIFVRMLCFLSVEKGNTRTGVEKNWQILKP
jgi:hypothetical protein